MSLVISKVFTYDTDAGNYIQAVEAADGQVLEGATRQAINNFVIGCKQDGVWSAIKASCILAGARTLSGALVPLAGTAPTNFNFVSGDYNRKTGLVGDGSSKYLDSNRNNNADPQNSKHISLWQATGGNNCATMGAKSNNASAYMDTGGTGFRPKINNTSVSSLSPAPQANTFFGASRDAASFFNYRFNGRSGKSTANSSTPVSDTTFVFARRSAASNLAEGFTAGRIAFYSIGESLDLALLDTRVTTMINAFAAAIP
jgi:hypothetical protein